MAKSLEVPSVFQRAEVLGIVESLACAGVVAALLLLSLQLVALWAGLRNQAAGAAMVRVEDVPGFIFPARVALLALVALSFVPVMLALRWANRRALRCGRDLESVQLALRESHHRIQNNLQSVIAMLELQAVAAPGVEERTALRVAQSRLRAAGVLHEHLCQSVESGQVVIVRHIRAVIDAALVALGRAADTRVVVKLPQSLALAPDRAFWLGAIINELVTNSAKHAVHGDDRLAIGVWIGRDARGLMLKYGDNGGRPGATSPSPKRLGYQGNGRKLMGAFVKQLRGCMGNNFNNPSQHSVRIVFPN